MSTRTKRKLDKCFMECEPDKKRSRVGNNPDNDSNTIDTNLSLVSSKETTLLPFDTQNDTDEFLLIYTTLIQLNLFNLIVPIDILKIIAYNSVGTIILCPICTISETLIMFSNMNQFDTCSNKKCDNYNSKLVCCQTNQENQIKCDLCDKIYCVNCCDEYDCLHKCFEIGCGDKCCDSCSVADSGGYHCCNNCYNRSIVICKYCHHFFENGYGARSVLCSSCETYHFDSNCCGDTSCIEQQLEDARVYECHNCGEIYCSNCRQPSCEICGLDDKFCKECVVFYQCKVQNCGTMICQHCMIECDNIECETKCCKKDCVRHCDECGTNWCNDCAKSNQYCNRNGDYCTCHELDDDDIDDDQDDGSES